MPSQTLVLGWAYGALGVLLFSWLIWIAVALWGLAAESRHSAWRC